MKNKFAYIIVALLVNAYIANGQEANVKEYSATRIIKPPVIDGVLEDEAWKNIPCIKDFTQSDPYEGKEVFQNTEVKIVYDNYAVYVAGIMYDKNPDSILHELGFRAEENLNSDIFTISFDNNNKNHDYYTFEVYASGVQKDSKKSDPTFDGVWESSSKVTGYGWVVEIKIPYSCIRFPSTEEQEWGLQITRGIRRIREFDQWARVPKGVNNSQLYWGKLRGIKNIKSPLRLSLTPYVSAIIEKYPLLNSDNIYNYYNSTSYNLGADLKYGIDDRYTLDMTLLPDFNQVQSDMKIKNLSYEEVTYTENRSYFKESIELFNKGGLFYSRRIGKTPTLYYDAEDSLEAGEKLEDNPTQTKLLNATKISGRSNNGLALGFFNAITDNMYASVIDSTGRKRKILTEPLTNYNILVIDKQLKNNSSFYLINTSTIRDKKYDNADVSGAGFVISNNKDIYAIYGNGAVSQKDSKNPASGSTGFKYLFGFKKTSGNFLFDASHELIDSRFDSQDMGYYIINNKMNELISFRYNIYKPSKWFLNLHNTLQYGHSTNPVTSKIINSQISYELDFTSPGHITYRFEFVGCPLVYYDYDEPRIAGRYSKEFRHLVIMPMISTDYRKTLAVNIHFTGWRNMDLNTKNGFDLIDELRVRVNDKLGFIYDNEYSYDPEDIGFASISDANDVIYGCREIKVIANSISIKYVFKKDMTLSIIGRHYWKSGEYKKYYLLLENGELSRISNPDESSNFNYNVFNIDVIYSWQFAPGSIISVAYKNAVETEKQYLIYNYFSNFKNTIDSPQTNGLSLKILYYLDYSYLKKRNVG
ncbi:MAG: DUF5916 domain-containing protein [Bacteroidales bacterium]|nr:DUF5916 domain-containing protein [Bacteroidales bacterium]